MTYAQQLNRPEWRKLRKELIEQNKGRCENCNAVHLPLQVHHMVYISGAKAWEVPKEFLKVLCDVCHKAEHNYQKKIESEIHQMLSEGITYREIFEILNAVKIHVYG